jgi:hypothetical protein
MEFPVASPKPESYELATNNFVIKKPINDIWTLLINYFEDRVVWNFNGKIMQCKTVCLLNIIEFDIFIFKYGESHVVEFRRMSGCRYGFSEFIGNIENDLHLNFTTGKCAMATNPPDLPFESYDDTLVDFYNKTYDLVIVNRPMIQRLNGFRSFGSIKKIYFKSLDEPFDKYSINTNRPEFVKLMRETARVAEDKDEFIDLRIIALAAINTFIKFCKEYIQTPVWIDEIYDLYISLNDSVTDTKMSLLQFEIKNGIRLFEQYHEIKAVLSS